VATRDIVTAASIHAKGRGRVKLTVTAFNGPIKLDKTAKDPILIRLKINWFTSTVLDRRGLASVRSVVDTVIDVYNGCPPQL
jgi:hypothetical protein